ncbi:MAG: hypothetical protein A3A58_02165 [Candidatus Blackburnbacteria bacterium RIFCSPLOWO2_01_FULL_41_27]|uniref:DUF378 domain-containing protein n=2 Tax=Candidatus Blackburniibacteriota TaxID=1817898 RepID=A0A1G1V723_9BACT|nr:MAG: hypothetical protein A3F61_02795 [Candidatus Blackburnbacteria bacterium RIFCSPHIGHO2_12_FULL_41_13b]OGY13776.1 MAG: hypothetical protein A3A58_02165 [Candidatus Blackburnbacteria bacterium RIFCSPLOWO2_01_FULL_41_27]TSC90081.1 MAG: hypothetical protein G01um10145_185 [Microgenomates group bacterium Gr01-1014_5]
MAKGTNSTVETLGWWLVVIGAVNWGLVGLASFLGGGDWNLVNMLLGSWPAVENLVYVLVGAAGLWMLTAKMS